MLEHQNIDKNKRKHILEISSYPPPRTGWGVRVEYVRKQLLHMGHHCEVMNIGESRKIESKEYVDVQNGLDYVRKLIRYCLKGYILHMHVNGKSYKGLMLTLIAEIISLVFGRRCLLTFHAGVKQTYFPMENTKWFCIPVFLALFSIPKLIICNDETVKQKIMEYGIKGSKIVPVQAFSRQYLNYREVQLPVDLKEFIRRHTPILVSYILLRSSYCIGSTIKALNGLREKWPDIGLIFVGSNVKAEDVDVAAISNLIRELAVGYNIFWTGDLTHDEFMTTLKSSHIFVRTPIDDGICASVLEALSLRIPVVATRNDLRPKGIIAFGAGDEDELAEKIRYVLDNYKEVKTSLPLPLIGDTVSEEAELLVS